MEVMHPQPTIAKDRQAPKLGQRQGVVSLSNLLEGISPANSLISHVWPPKLTENIFLLF